MPTLRVLRERALLSQSELAKAVGVNRHTIYFWESGLKSPKPAHRRKLVEILRCTPEELLAALEATKGDEAPKDKPENVRAA